MAADASEGGEGTWAELRKGIEWERRTIQRTVLGPPTLTRICFCAFTGALASTKQCHVS